MSTSPEPGRKPREPLCERRSCWVRAWVCVSVVGAGECMECVFTKWNIFVSSLLCRPCGLQREQQRNPPWKKKRSWRPVNHRVRTGSVALPFSLPSRGHVCCLSPSHRLCLSAAGTCGCPARGPSAVPCPPRLFLSPADGS